MTGRSGNNVNKIRRKKNNKHGKGNEEGKITEAEKTKNLDN